MKCEYGCGQEAQYQFKNGKWCCSKYSSQCPVIRETISKKTKLGMTDEIKKHISKMQKGKPRPNLSEKTKEKIRKANIGKKLSGEIKKRMIFFKKGHIPWNKGKTGVFSKKTLNEMSKKHQRENLSSETLEKMSKANKGRKQNEEEIEKRRQKNLGKKRTEAFKKRLSNLNKGKVVSEKTKNKLKILNRQTIENIKQKYPFFSRIEEMRYNPDKPGEKEIQVHCKNHLCENSKERGGWFTPTYSQLYERIRQLQKNGIDLCYFYCSQDCKNVCPLYKLQANPYKETKNQYSLEEYQIFRKFVLERDNNQCQYCGEKAEHVHHERPQKLEPFFALDPDYAWSVCKKCHYKYGHKDECSTGKLANKICIGDHLNEEGTTF